jgi:beta-lactam-binding protein with PASTA domain
MKISRGLLPAFLSIACGALLGQQRSPQAPPKFLSETGGPRHAAARNRVSLRTVSRRRDSSSGSSTGCKLYTFEGLPNQVQIPSFDGITATGWYSGISDAAGGTAQFINAPSGITAAVFYAGGTDDIDFAVPVGSVQFWYATGYAFTVTAYDQNGNVVASEDLPSNWDGNPAGYEVWTQIPPLASSQNAIASIEIDSEATLNNFLGIDNLNVCRATTIASVEMTQAIQQIQNLPDLKSSLASTGEAPVPIIAGKRGVMRIYVNPPTDVTDVNIQLNIPGVINQTKESELMPSCSRDDQRYVRNGCSSTDFYFPPPSGSWTATIDVTDPDSGGLIEEDVLPFQSRNTNPLILKGSRVCDWEVEPGQWTDCTNSEDLLNNMGLLPALAPTNTVTPLATSNTVNRDYSSTPGPTAEWKDYSWWRNVDLDLTKLWIQIDSDSDPVNNLHTTYFGIIRQGFAPQCCIGLAYKIPSHAAAGWNHAPQWGVDLATWVVAHETGHTLGLQHTNSPNPPNPAGPTGCWMNAPSKTPGWPFLNNYLQSQANLEVGFDVLNRKAKIPTDDFELMGYCYPEWISPLRYKTMIPNLGGGVVTSPSMEPVKPAPEDRKPKPRVSATQPFWLVSGIIPSSGAAQFEPMFEQVLTSDTSGGSGTYSLVVENSTGGALFTQYFDPGVATDFPDETVDLPQPFAALVPVTAGASQIVLQDPTGTPLGQIAMGGVAPTVAITNPTATFDGTTPITWTITDPDSSTFDSKVLYSTDNGNTWSQIGEVGSGGTSLTADFSTLPGTNGQGLIRVLVSDGVNTGSATSPNFSIPKKVPTVVKILAPAPGSAQPVFDQVWFTGLAYDPDDGMLSGTELAWSSDIQGPLGWGGSLTVTLMPGVHTITLTATDSDGNSISTSETITIAYDPPQLGVSFNALTMPPASASSCIEAMVSAAPGANGAPLSNVQYSVDGGQTYTNIPINLLPYTFYVPGTGLISLVVQATDTAGQSYAGSMNYFNLYPCGALAVPNVVGQTQTDAGNLLAGNGFVAGVVTQAASTTVAAGTVISQNPAGGTSMAPGSSADVILVISNGPQVGVPNVVGMAQGAATQAITSAGLTLGPVTNSSSSTVPFGLVISETPAAGVSANAGAAVSLAVSTGAALAIASPAVLPAGTAGSAYAPTTVVASGGTPPYSWSATGLPSNLAIDPAAGMVTGTPSSNTGSPFGVTVTVTDSNSITATKSYNLVIDSALVLDPTNSLPAGTAGVAYSAPALRVTGGSGSYRWLATGQAPGLKIDPAAGAISGVPASNAGSPYTVQVIVQDSNGAIASGSYTQIINAGSGNPCDITGTGPVNIGDIQLAVNESLGMAAARDDLNNDGMVDVIDIQILINTVLGGTCMAL